MSSRTRRQSVGGRQLRAGSDEKAGTEKKMSVVCVCAHFSQNNTEKHEAKGKYCRKIVDVCVCVCTRVCVKPLKNKTKEKMQDTKGDKTLTSKRH